MVVPIIAGGAILAFVTWGEGVFGQKSFNQIIRAGVVLGILIIVYIGYKAYKAYMDAKEAVEDVYEGVMEKTTQTYEDILNVLGQAGERGEESYKWITEGTPEEHAKFVTDIVVEKPKEIVLESWELSVAQDIGNKAGFALLKAKKDLLNAPSYYAEKLKFW